MKTTMMAILAAMLAVFMLPVAQAADLDVDDAQAPSAAGCTEDLLARKDEPGTATGSYGTDILSNTYPPLGYVSRTSQWAFAVADPFLDFVDCVV